MADFQEWAKLLDATMAQGSLVWVLCGTTAAISQSVTKLHCKSKFIRLKDLPFVKAYTFQAMVRTMGLQPPPEENLLAA